MDEYCEKSDKQFNKLCIGESIDLKADIVLQSYGLLEKPNCTGKNVSEFSTGCFSTRTIFSKNGPIIYGRTDVIWSTVLTTKSPADT